MEYDMIDRFLRNNLGDDDYAEYSAALDSLCTPQRTWVGLTGEDIRQLEKENTVGGYHGDYCPTWDLIEATEAKLKEKNT